MAKVGDEWINGSDTVLGLPAVRHRWTDEVVLSGQRGDIYKVSDTMLGAILIPGKYQSKVFTLLGIKKKASLSDEVLVEFEHKHLNAMLELLQVSKQRATQARCANTFTIRSDAAANLQTAAVTTPLQSDIFD